MAQLERYVAERASAETAMRYVDRLFDQIDGLAKFPERYAERPELGQDVRALVYDGSIRVPYRVEPERVLVIALFGSGQLLRQIEDIS